MQITQFVRQFAKRPNQGLPSPRRYEHQTAVDLSDFCHQVLQEFLTTCSIPFYVTPLDAKFSGLCMEDAARRGCIMSGPLSVVPFIPDGVAMALTAYAHLKTDDERVYIALYTALLIYIEDIFYKDMGIVQQFNSRFTLHQPKGNAVLDALSDLLLEMPSRFDSIVANIMITSTLNLVTAALLEDQLEKISLPSEAYAYPSFSRTMSGAGETYALFAFSRSTPCTHYIQALPEMRTFINVGNDILSFYKEEIRGEVDNHITMFATCTGAPKYAIFQFLADEVASAYIRSTNALAAHPKALQEFTAFGEGYIGFHASSNRYRLGDLNL